MNRLCCSLLSLVLVAGTAAHGDDRPNFLFIVADDLGYAELGCYGQEKIRTPRIDQMASEGMRFTQHYAGNAVCAPSRCVLMTGRHSGHAVVRNNQEVRPEGQFPLPASEVTLAELLQQQGYATGAFGKWGLGPVESSGDPLAQGFDRFFGYNCQRQAHNYYPTSLWDNSQRRELAGNSASITGAQYAPDLYLAAAVDFIEAHRDQPFLVYFPSIVPHLALQVPEDSLEEYVGRWPETPYRGGKGYLPHPRPHAAYAAMVSRLDRDVGTLLDTLDRLQLARKTVVVFTSDNGPAHAGIGGTDSDFFESAGSLRGTKGSLYEGGIRVPLIVRWPGRIAPGVSDHPCAFYDWLPTLMDLCDAGSVVPSDIDGLSFAPELLGKGEQPKHEFLYWEFPSYGGQQAIRLGDWKGVRQDMLKKSPQTVPPLELYDLRSDLGESNNVAADHQDVVRQMETILKREHRPSQDFPFPALDGG